MRQNAPGMGHQQSHGVRGMPPGGRRHSGGVTGSSVKMPAGKMGRKMPTRAKSFAGFVSF